MSELRVEGITFSYPGRPRVLDDVDLTVGTGEAVAVIGASGAGKSTLFRLVAGLAKPEKGRVLLGGREVQPRTPELVGAIGYIHQQHGLPTSLSVETAVLTASMHAWSPWRVLASPLVGPTPSERRLIDDVLIRVGLEGRRGDRVSELSVGQRQRVAVARTLLQQPQLVVADEPVASVDPATADIVLGLLAAEARRGAAVLCSVHDVDRAVPHFERIVALADGGVVFDGRREDLTEDVISSIYAREAR